MRTQTIFTSLLLAGAGAALATAAVTARNAAAGRASRAAADPPYRADLRELAEQSSDFRRVVFTGPNVQVVLMSLRPGEEIGEETHDVDQCLFFVDGAGESVIAGKSATIAADDVLCIPAGTRHNIRNGKGGPLKLYTVYAPPEHAPGTVHHTKRDAERAEHEHTD
jgi:mannose-6-phosphate isomerase-like protein (cupin superfamily)